MALGNPLEAPLRSGKDTGEGGDGGGVAGVSSFKGRTGAVVPQNGDYNAGQITETASAKLMTAAERDKLTALDSANYATAAQGALADTALQAEDLAGYQVEPAEGAFVDGDKSKLDGIESGATGDQTGAEIKIAYEGEADTNAFTDLEKSKLAAIEDGAKDDQTGAEIVGLIDTELGGTDWQSGGSGGGSATVLWASKVESVDVPGSGFEEVVLTATGATPTGHVTDLIEIPTTDDDVSAWARVTANDTITIRVSTIGPAVTVSGTWKVSWVAKTSYSWFSHTVNETVAGSDFTTVTVPALGVANATHVVKFIYLPTTSVKLKAWSVVGTDEVTVRIENTDAPGVLLDGDVEVVTQLKTAAFPDPGSLVDSVFGRTGAVVAVSGDYDADQITETATNKIMTATERSRLAAMEDRVTVATVAALASSTATYVDALGYYATNDGGEGSFQALESGATVDGGHVFAHGSGGDWRYHRRGVSLGVADAGHFGLRLSGDAAHRTTNTDALQRAVDYLASASAAYYGGGFRLKIRKGAGAGYIDDEITVPTTISRFQMVGEGGVELIQYTTNKGFLIFTKNEVDTNTSLHRHVLVEHIHFTWFAAQSLTDVRSNVFALTNYPYGSGGVMFAFVSRHCSFSWGRRVFTTVDAGETDAPTAGAWCQSVTIEHCRYQAMSGALYHISDTSVGGPQLTIRNINSYCGYTVGATRTKRLAEPFIYINQAIGVILDQIENLGSDREFCYIGVCKTAKISNIQIEDHDMADATHLIKLNGSGTFCTIENLYWVNSTIPADRWIVGTYQAFARIVGGIDIANMTHTGGANLYVAGRYGASTGVIYWDANQRFDNATDKFTRAAADASNVINWTPATITQP